MRASDRWSAETITEPMSAAGFTSLAIHSIAEVPEASTDYRFWLGSDIACMTMIHPH